MKFLLRKFICRFMLKISWFYFQVRFCGITNKMLWKQQKLISICGGENSEKKHRALFNWHDSPISLIIVTKVSWQIYRGHKWPLKLLQFKTKPISITNKWLMGIKLSFSFFSVFINANNPTRTLEQKLGRLGDANQTFVSVALVA